MTKVYSKAIVGAGNFLNTGTYIFDSAPGNTTLSVGHTVALAPAYVMPEPTWTTALISGFSKGDSRVESEVGFNCPTGNCTWTPYASLAVCSACNNVTDHLNRSENLFSLPYVSLFNPSIPQLPGSEEIFTYVAAATVVNPGHTISFQDMDTLIAAVGIIKPGENFEGFNMNDVSVLAAECSLYFCVNAYQSKVIGGVMKESVTPLGSQRVAGSYAPVRPMDPETLAEYEIFTNHSICGPGYVGFNRSDLQLQISPDQARQAELPSDAPLIFNITQRTLCTASYTLEKQVFQGGVANWPGLVGQNALPTLVASVLNRSQSQGIPIIFDNIAQSLTTWIRDNADDSQIGYQEEWVIYIQVQWLCLIMPLCITMCGCLFLGLTIVETQHAQLPSWKAGVLPNLAHALDTDTRNQLRLAAANGVMEKVARKDIIVKLQKTNTGFELKAQQPCKKHAAYDEEVVVHSGRGAL